MRELVAHRDVLRLEVIIRGEVGGCVLWERVGPLLLILLSIVRALQLTKGGPAQFEAVKVFQLLPHLARHLVCGELAGVAVLYCLDNGREHIRTAHELHAARVHMGVERTQQDVVQDSALRQTVEQRAAYGEARPVFGQQHREWLRFGARVWV